MDFSTTHIENEELASWEISLARKLARHFHLAYRFTPAIDEDDLAQECLTHWWQQRHRYSAERGASQKTYMRAVLQKKLLDIARREGAEKRRSQTEAVSLNREIDDEEEDGGLVVVMNLREAVTAEARSIIARLRQFERTPPLPVVHGRVDIEPDRRILAKEEGWTRRRFKRRLGPSRRGAMLPRMRLDHPRLVYKIHPENVAFLNSLAR